MANERDRDELDRNPPADEAIQGVGDDEFEDTDDEEDLEDDELTGEIGSEGGSPGPTRRQ